MNDEPNTPTLLEWLDAELEYHGMMMECCQGGPFPYVKAEFTSHNIAHLHLTRIRALVVKHATSASTGVPPNEHRP